jgi:branched-chain amino acid aminotransferase
LFKGLLIAYFVSLFEKAMLKQDFISITKTTNSKLSQTDFNNLRFGREFSDHMFMMDYKDGEWTKPQIIPFQNLSLNPATSALHYGQSIFEGLKAYKGDNGKIGIFRPDKNFARMNKSAERMCMPQIPEYLFFEALTKLVSLDKEWIPSVDGSSLYIRPYMFATDEYIGVKASDTYKFVIFTCPVNTYYTAPVKVKLETHFTRATKGGTGYAKAAGNYAGALYPARMGNLAGFDQMLWTDAAEHKYIEESGTMNIFFVVDDTLMTPKLSETILDGVTRDSVLKIATEWGMKVEEKRVSIEEIISAIEKGTLKEAFGAGTAATIAPIQMIGYNDIKYTLPEIETRVFSNKVIKYLDDIKRFRVEDKNYWMRLVE